VTRNYRGFFIHTAPRYLVFGKAYIKFEPKKEVHSVITMDKKTIYIVVAVVVVILVVGIAGVMLLNNGGNGGTDTTPTPEPTQTPVADATSLEFTVTDSSGTYEYKAKNIGSETQLSIEYVDATFGFSIIINGTSHEAYSDMTGTWQADDFQTTWDQWYPLFEGYVDSLAHWTSGDYTSEDGTTTISNIVVNPTIDDSVFEVPMS